MRGRIKINLLIQVVIFAVKGTSASLSGGGSVKFTLL